jgi:Xaa-Pro aminopeptidase
MKNVEIYNKIKKTIDENQLDALILGGTYNIQYATGVRIPCAHAQTDLVMFAVFAVGKEPAVFVPKCWESVARQTCYFSNIKSYDQNKIPVEAAVEALTEWCRSTKRIGIDDERMSAAKNLRLSHAFDQVGANLIPCTPVISKTRSIKTETEVEWLKSIAYKTDHIINGHFHHLIADRLKSASSIS